MKLRSLLLLRRTGLSCLGGVEKKVINQVNMREEHTPTAIASKAEFIQRPLSRSL